MNIRSFFFFFKTNQSGHWVFSHNWTSCRNKNWRRNRSKKACLNENQCPRIRKWVGIYETLKNGSIVLLGATLEPLCWSRWLGTNSPVFCKSGWHWILSWESWALCHKRHSVQGGNTHTHTQHIPFSPQEVSHAEFVIRDLVIACVWDMCVCP